MGRRWFGYLDDFGQVYAVQLDEKNVELVNAPSATAPANVPGVRRPEGLTLRYARYNSSDGLYSRSVTILSNTPEALAGIPPVVEFPTSDGTIAMQLTSYIGERQQFVTTTDTRQLDGDLENYGVAPPEPPAGI